MLVGRGPFRAKLRKDRMQPEFDDASDSTSTANGDSGSAGAEEAEGSDATTEGDSGKQDVTAKRLEDTSVALKEAQRELHATKEAIAEMRGMLLAAKESKTEEADWLNADTLKEMIAKKMEDDPSAAVALAVEQAIRGVRSDVAKLLDSRDKYFNELVSKQVKSAYDPERAALRDTIAELDKKDWFAGLDDQTKVKVAKDFAQKSGQKVSPPGGMAGSGRRIATAKDEGAEKQKRLLALAAEVFGDQTYGTGKVKISV